MERLRRTKPKRTIAGDLLLKRSQKAAEVETNPDVLLDGLQPPKQKLLVPCVRHEDREFGHIPCLLSKSLEDQVATNCILRVVSRQQPELRFFVRAHPDNFDGSVRGISVLQTLAERAKLTDKDVELVEVPEEEAHVDSMVMVLGERYMSQRDLWHMHLAMMQESALLLYMGFRQNLRQHISTSSIERLAIGKHQVQKEVCCGLVSTNTEVTFRSGSANMFVLLQVSSELFQFGLSGRPYWELLVGCFLQLVENSLRVQSCDYTTTGHYIHMILFARARGASAGESAAPEHDCSDYYDVFWEGYAKAMPPAQVLAARVRQVCMCLHEQDKLRKRHSAGNGEDAPTHAGGSRAPFDFGANASDAWPDVLADNITEASKGNILECLNLVLDHFDQHHLDRMLKVSGQSIVLLSAGSGVIHASSTELYRLTHQRFIAAGGHPAQLEMICVREQPLHAVPWVQWPGSSLQMLPRTTKRGGIGVLRVDMSPLPHIPPWAAVTFYPEISVCPCRPATDCWLRSSLLPLDCAAKGFAPSQIPLLSDVEVPSGPTQSHKPASHSQFGPKSSLAARKTIEELWKDVRTPRLRPYLSNSATTHQTVGRPLQVKTSHYELQPERFRSMDEEAEQVEVMADLIGLRLAVLGSTEVYLGEEGNHLVQQNSPLPKEHSLFMRPNSSFDSASGTSPFLRPAEGVPKLSPLCGPVDGGPCASRDFQLPASFHPVTKETWAMQGNLLPWKMRSATVRTHCGQLWKMVRREEGGLLVESIDPLADDIKARRASELAVGYTQFNVRYRLVRKQPACETEDINEASSRSWVLGRRIFHTHDRLLWNELDSIVAGHLRIPAALPYPIECSASGIDDKCPGWRLRTALKQHLFMLVPCDPAARSHRKLFEKTLRELNGEISIGVDPFEVLEEGADVIEDSALRKTLEQFCRFREGLDRLCYGASKGKRVQAINISVEKNKYEVKRRRNTVYVKDMDISSSWQNSRDWFEIFYDSHYNPPQMCILVVEWLVCSSMHMVNFMTKLSKIAEGEANQQPEFSLLRLPISMLFPQPAPPWVWGQDQETNFDRLAFYPRRKLRLPPTVIDAARRRLYAKLLERWLQPDLDLMLIFSASGREFEAVALHGDSHNHRVHQRNRGWVLCDAKGLCMVALRETRIFWIENVLPLVDARTAQHVDQHQQGVEQLRRTFFTATKQILAAAEAEAAQAASEGSLILPDLSSPTLHGDASPTSPTHDWGAHHSHTCHAIGEASPFTLVERNSSVQ